MTRLLTTLTLRMETGHSGAIMLFRINPAVSHDGVYS